MSETTIPQPIIDAINAMLAPYGKKYDPSGSAPATGKGYLPMGPAAKYMGISKSSFRSLVVTGRLPRPFKVTPARNGIAVYAIEDLDSFLRSCR